MSSGDKSDLEEGHGDDKESSQLPSQKALHNNVTTQQEITNNTFNNDSNHNQSNDPAKFLKDGSPIDHMNENGDGSDICPIQENDHIYQPVEHENQIGNNNIRKQHSSEQATSLEGNSNDCSREDGAHSNHYESEDNHNKHHMSDPSSSSAQHQSNKEIGNNESSEMVIEIQEGPNTKVPNLQELTQSVTIGDGETSHLVERKDMSEVKVAFILLFLIIVVGSTIYLTLPKNRNKDWF